MIHLTVEWFSESKYPSFNLNLHSKEGAPSFITVRGCRIVEGKDGPFVSYPAQKNEKTGKWWNHVQGSDRFNDEVLLLAKAKMPQQQRQEPARGQQGPGDLDDSIPW